MGQKTQALVKYLEQYANQYVKSRQIRAALFPNTAPHSAIIRWHVARARAAGVRIRSSPRRGFGIFVEKAT